MSITFFLNLSDDLLNIIQHANDLQKQCCLLPLRPKRIRAERPSYLECKLSKASIKTTIRKSRTFSPSLPSSVGHHRLHRDRRSTVAEQVGYQMKALEPLLGSSEKSLDNVGKSKMRKCSMATVQKLKNFLCLIIVGHCCFLLNKLPKY